MDWNKTFIKIALLYAEHSKCLRKKVAAVLVKDKRIICSGLNGTASGTENCCDHFKDYDLTSKEFYNDHGKWSKENALHAEQNCLAICLKNGLSTEECTMYLTLSPCLDCAQLLFVAGIKEIYYLEKYDRDTSGTDYLKKNNIKIEQIIL